MTAAEQEPEFVWPRHWGYHSQPHHDTQACPRCQREADHIEAHLECYCVDHDWRRVDTGPGPYDQLVWVCSECLRLMGPAYSGPTP